LDPFLLGCIEEEKGRRSSGFGVPRKRRFGINLNS
jgi:hypothetical protein